MKTKTLFLMPLFMVFCMQFTYAQTPLSGSQVDSYVESHYDNVLYRGIIYGIDDGDDGCWYGGISRASLSDFVSFENNRVDSVGYGLLVWVPGPDDSDGYLYDTGPYCDYDGNNLGYDGMTIYQINWDEATPDPEWEEIQVRIGPYFCNSDFLYANRIQLYIYYVIIPPEDF